VQTPAISMTATIMSIKVYETNGPVGERVEQDMSSPMPLDQPIQMLPLFRERVWGREDLRPYFLESPRKDRIGEVWFTFEENRTADGQTLRELLSASPEILGTAADPEHPGICPLLVKLLFTTERLSVQVHPEDDYAREHHGSLGKTEAWYVMDAQPPAEVAVGFQKPLTPEQLRETAVSGEIEGLLDWRKVAAGDLIFTPAGTVHAIGAGLTICEIQENSDITYRLYDYARIASGTRHAGIAAGPARAQGRAAGSRRRARRVDCVLLLSD
jgi:mannose-6-phosphate isomerase